MRRLAQLLCIVCWALPVASAEARAAPGSGDVHIDVPVVLKEAKVVFNLDHAAFAGDEPVGLDFLRVMTARFHADGTKAPIVAIFHGEVGYMLLNDASYDRVRNWQQGTHTKDRSPPCCGTAWR